MNYPSPKYQRQNAQANHSGQPSRHAAYPAARYSTARSYSMLGGYRAAGRPRYARWNLGALARSPWTLYLAVAALFSLALLPLFLLGGTYLIYLLSGRIFPGVMVGTVAGGDLARAELAQRLDEQWNRQKTIALSDGSHGLPVTPVEVGLWVDPQATAARAYDVGRGDGALKEVFWLLRFGRLEIKPAVVFNSDAARAGLQRLASQVETPAQNAALAFESGQWVAIPGKDGNRIDIEQTLQRMAAYRVEIVSRGLLPLVMEPVAPQVSNLTPALNQLRGALEQPLKLQAYDPVTDETIAIDVPHEIFAEWVTVNQNGSDITFGLDGQRVVAYLDEWKASLGPGRTLEPFTLPDNLAGSWQNGQAVTILVYHSATTYTVQAGDMLTGIAYQLGMPYWKIQEANPGLNPDHLVAGQELVIPSKNEMLPLPVILNKRIVISISQQRLWTYENGQQTREHVISTGIDRSPTIPGIYQIQTHELEAYASVWDLYMPHFMGIYEGWPGFMNGIHGLPTLSSGNRLWAGNLGRPVSYGCIILGLQEAEDLYNWTEEGVVVEIRP